METHNIITILTTTKSGTGGFENHVYPSQNELFLRSLKNITAKKQRPDLGRNFRKQKTRYALCTRCNRWDRYERKITIWNQQAEKLFGWNLKDIIGKSIVDTIIPKQLENNHLRPVSAPGWRRQQHYAQ